MDELQEIRLMNETRMLYLEKTGKENDKNKIISKILEDDSCFFKLNKDDAFMILKEIGIKEDKINEIYEKLISQKNYFNLKQSGKIKDDDKSVIIRYENKYDCKYIPKK